MRIRSLIVPGDVVIDGSDQMLDGRKIATPNGSATASGTNKKNFDILKSAFGFIPNTALAMAQSQAVWDGYMGAAQ